MQVDKQPTLRDFASIGLTIFKAGSYEALGHYLDKINKDYGPGFGRLVANMMDRLSQIN